MGLCLTTSVHSVLFARTAKKSSTSASPFGSGSASAVTALSASSGINPRTVQFGARAFVIPFGQLGSCSRNDPTFPQHSRTHNSLCRTRSYDYDRLSMVSAELIVPASGASLALSLSLSPSIPQNHFYSCLVDV